MAIGVLKRGFTIHTPAGIDIKIPKNTVVRFHSSTPTITFDGFPEVKLFRAGNKWYASVYGNIYLVLFDPQKPPYPISYFK
ncbi:MAG: hypothetical protein QXO15_03325 [Nitrososphaerota archaeon]